MSLSVVVSPSVFRSFILGENFRCFSIFIFRPSFEKLLVLIFWWFRWCKQIGVRESHLFKCLESVKCSVLNWFFM